MLQLPLEFLHYSEQFARASAERNEYLRMAKLISPFYMMLAHMVGRYQKPFNSLLGETFDLEFQGFRVVCEQVSHHPPISAFHAESEHVIVEGTFQVKIIFSKLKFSIKPVGTVNIVLKKWNERYSLLFPEVSIHNYVIGKMYI